MTIKELVETLTLDEKIALTIGPDSWHINGVPSKGIKEVCITDGPHGVRKAKDTRLSSSLNENETSVCFPPACLSACSWNEDMLYREGQAIGEECLKYSVSIVLGPGVNIKRSPLGGRNFEYFSEDPVLASAMASAWIKGVESTGTGTSLKHFAANNQEKKRMSSNSIIDERTLREIYLKAFERAVKEASPATLMCAYNRVNDVYASQNEFLLTKVLRNEWKYPGFVMTDWGATSDHAKGIKAGIDLEMPGPNEYSREEILKALEDGSLSMEDLNRSVERILEFLLKAEGQETKECSFERHHDISSEVAADSFVLLENDGTLPLDRKERILVVGAFAQTPRYQGAGSSRINSYKVTSLVSELKNLGYSVEYSQGYNLSGTENEELADEAVEKTENADIIVFVTGLPGSYESEGFDRTDLKIPAAYDKLAYRLIATGKKVVAVVYAGGVTEMPWRNDVSSLLYCYLGGEGVSEAVALTLSGAVNPSGHLAETFPLKCEDNPCFGLFATESENVEYREGCFVGYRYYETFNIPVAYPFGYGRSYTSFDVSDADFSLDGDSIIVSYRIKNTGSFAGSQVMQVYTGMPDSLNPRPVKELKAFRKTFLNPGESRKERIMIPVDELRIWSDGWKLENGVYLVHLAFNAHEDAASGLVELKGEKIELPNPYKSGIRISEKEYALLFSDMKIPSTDSAGCITVDSPVNEVLALDEGRKMFGPVYEQLYASVQGDDDYSVMTRAMLEDAPLRALFSFAHLDKKLLVEKLSELNKQL